MRTPIEGVAFDSEIALSFTQERLWFLDQLESNSAVYNVPWGLRIRGPLNVAALGRGLREIVRRHEVLRTTFSLVDSRLQQIVHHPSEFCLPVADLRSVPEAKRRIEAQRLAREEASQSFDLSQDLFLRARLIQLDEREHWLLLTMHQIAPDRRSIELIHQELAALYTAYSTDQPSPLPELPLQYVDYARWQRRALLGDELDRQLAYWKQQLSGAPALLNLPTDYPRPAAPANRGALEDVRLSEELSWKLRELSRGEGATLFMTLLAAFQVLLSRYSRQEDVCVGAPIDARTRTEHQGLIGPFVNLLVLRTDLSGDPTFRLLLKRVADVTRGAFSNADVPFGKLVQELRPQRNLGSTPLFQTMLVLDDAPRPPLEIVNLDIDPLAVHNETSRFDLTLSLAETVDGLKGVMEYSRELFDASTIQRMMAHLQVLLEAIVADPDRRIGELPLITDGERQQLLVEWNDTRSNFPQDKRVQELFEAQVNHTPDAVAIEFEGRRLTYRELNTRSNRVAHELIGLGVAPDQLVGLYLERSLDLIVAMLAVLKAGGAYVPLDPAYPADRLAFMLEDSQAPIVVTHQRLLHKLKIRLARVVCLDSEKPCIDHTRNLNPTPAGGPTNLAYVIYTSGSTGKPKGVAIEHRSTVTLIKWAQTVFTAEELSGVLASTSTCFDLSVYELFVPLCSGGRVILVENASALLALSPEADVKLINTVPSAMAELLRYRAVPDSAVTINLAGEPLPTELVNRIYRETKVKRIYDLYGPTEDTTYSTYALRLPELPATIGRPISDTQAYVFDQLGHPVPIGVPGELYLGGAGLARGYLHRPELTSEKFVMNPVTNAPSDRLYRTGDLARYRPDGNLEYLGRLDRQVKLRGFRIELGEIEAALARHPQVQRAVVVLRDDGPGGKCLVAYVVPKGREDPPVAELRSELSRSVPDFMIPSAFVTLNALPLTPNGKVDARALPAPDRNRRQTRREYVAPRTPIEQELADLWCTVLRTDLVSIHDNFFELGGCSLTAVEAIHRLRNRFAVDLPLRSLFEFPTIAEIGGIITGALGRHKKSVDSRSTTASPGEGEATGRPFRPAQASAAEKIVVRGQSIDPHQFCEVIRWGAGEVPLVCVGDARPIPFILARMAEAVPLVHLKLDGVHFWPPYHLSAADQSDVYAQCLARLSMGRKVAIVGWSYGGILGYQLAAALMQRGWSEAGILMIEPDTPIRFQRFWRYHFARQKLRRMISPARIRAALKNLKVRNEDGTGRNTADPGDGYARWDRMIGHYQRNIDSIRPAALPIRIALVGSADFFARHVQHWRRIASNGLDECVFSQPTEHTACFRQPAADQWLAHLDLWHKAIVSRATAAQRDIDAQSCETAAPQSRFVPPLLTSLGSSRS